MAFGEIERIKEFWHKVRHRKMVQWGIAYVAGAWALLQAFAYVATTFSWPQPVQQFTTLDLAIGLPIVLVVAWYHGDRGEQRAGAAEIGIIAGLL